MESVKKFYTYIHLRNDTSEVFYVGKGRGKRAYSKYCRNNLWHKIANKHGYTVMIIFLWDSEGKAFEHEKELIKTYREKGNLLANFTDGGDGVSGYKHDEKSRKKLSKTSKDFWSNDQSRLKMCAIRKLQITPDLKKKLSEVHTKRWSELSEEKRKQHSESIKSAYSSEEKRKMQADRNRAFRESEEGRKAFSDRVKKYWQSEKAQTEEAKIQRSQAIKRAWETRRANKCK